MWNIIRLQSISQKKIHLIHESISKYYVNKTTHGNHYIYFEVKCFTKDSLLDDPQIQFCKFFRKA